MTETTPETSAIESTTTKAMTSDSVQPAPEKTRGARKRINIVWNEWWVTLGAFFLALVFGAILLVVSDPDIMAKWNYFFARPSDALQASWDRIYTAFSALIVGSVGSIQALSETSAQAAPLICAGLAVAVAFQAGLFNIGAQGQAIWGAVFAAYIGFAYHLPPVIHMILAVLCGVIGGTFLGWFVGFLRAKTGANEVIVTIMLNYTSAHALLWLLMTDTFRRPGRADPISPPVLDSALLYQIPGTRFNLGFVLAILAAILVWWLLDRTRTGFAIRAVGANPSAAATAGMKVGRTLMITMAIAGGLAGLAGLQFVLAPTMIGIPIALASGVVGSVGFDAITVALLGRSRPLGTVLAGLLFGAMKAGSLQLQAIGLSADLATVLQSLIVMFVAAPMLVRTLLPFLKERKRKAQKALVVDHD